MNEAVAAQTPVGVRLLTAYVDAFNSRDPDQWEAAFDATWHHRAEIDGKSVEEFRETERSLLGRFVIETVEFLPNRDGPDRFDYRMSVSGRTSGPYTATVADGLLIEVWHR